MSPVRPERRTLECCGRVAGSASVVSSRSRLLSIVPGTSTRTGFRGPDREEPPNSC